MTRTDRVVLSPREVFVRYLRTGLAGDRDAQVELFAADAIVDFPFAPPGVPRRFQGREEIRNMLTALEGGTQRAEMRIKEEDSVVLVVHETTNPEVVIAEIEARVEVGGTGESLRVPYIQVYRVRDGQIVSFRDYWAAETGEFVKAILA
ncbi:MAG: nuclear transport factor 2 family protein [Streptosporangiales bacterium]|nr:nuclear transport factor 2 family protein [Streptosporangiales bacterium]